MKRRALHVVVNRQPLEEPLLHLRRTKAQPVADVVEQKKVAVGKQTLRQECLQRQIAELRAALHWEDIENISVQHEERVSAGVPTTRHLQRPSTQRQTRRALACLHRLVPAVCCFCTLLAHGCSSLRFTFYVLLLVHRLTAPPALVPASAANAADRGSLPIRSPAAPESRASRPPNP